MIQPNIPGTGAPTNWRRLVKGFIRRRFREGQEFSSDEVRLGCSEQGIFEPPEPNAWGGVYRELAAENEIEWTGRMVKSRLRKAKGRLVRVWKRKRGARR